MGKRELILVVAFLVLGGLVYQLTAPRGAEPTSGRSWADALRSLRGEVFGSRARLTVERNIRASVDTGVTTLDLGELSGQIAVVGEDRDDIEATVRVSLLGENEAEISTAAARLVVTSQVTGDTLRLALSHPDAWRLGRGRISGEVTMRAPARLRVKLAGRGTVNVTRMAGAAIELTRGSATLTTLSGPVSGELRDASLDVNGAAGVDVETRRVSVRLSDVAGPVTIEAVDGGVRAAHLPGPVTLDVRRVMVDLDGIIGPVKITAVDGQTELRGLSGPLTVDAERMSLLAAMAGAAEVTAEVSEAPFEFTLPPAGVALDVEAIDGAIDAPTALGAVEKDGTTQRLKATVKGGGVPVRLRGTRTTVVVRTP